MLKGILLLALTTLVSAQSPSSEPCASVAAQLEQSSSIEAQVAFDCLDSVPVDVQGNTQLIDELKQLWQFQSELVWLKNPGDDWEFGALDVEAELDNVKNNLNSFSSEYAVQLAIQNITIRTGNFHFNYRPDILMVFDFFRQINVASISEDGKALPKLYLADDVASVAEGSSDVSEITDINGQNPYDFLKSVSWSQYIDSDGLINSMLAKGDTDNTGAFMNQRKYDGPSTDVTWANGSTASIPNGASSDRSFVGITDGQSFFDAFCTGSSISSFSASTKADSDSSGVALPKPKLPAAINHIIAPSAPGPVPRIPTGVYHRRNKRQTMTPSSGTYAENMVAEDASGTVAGFFLNGDGYDDIAVLKIISFSNPGDELSETEYGNDFQVSLRCTVSI
jgi:hypothetical protein